MPFFALHSISNTARGAMCERFYTLSPLSSPRGEISLQDPENSRQRSDAEQEGDEEEQEEQEEAEPGTSRSLLNMWSEDSRGGSDDEYQYDDFVVPDDCERQETIRTPLKKRFRQAFINENEEGENDVVLYE